MLPSNTRLPKATFREVFATGRLVHSTFFILRMKKSQKTSRFAVSVSKKVSKSAVDRNRIRRRSYAAIASLLVKHPTFNFPVEIVCIAKDTAKKAHPTDIEADLTTAFVKNGILA
jgi:ribonuclease P protein component